MRRALGGWRRRAAALFLAAVVVTACGDGDDEQAQGQPTEKFACLDFVATVTSGPNTGRSWSGDLVLTPDETGAFRGLLVPPGVADRRTLEISDPSRATCRAIGQRNAAQASWFLYCPNREVIFGTGQVTVIGDHQELRGITNGPTDADFGVYHGRNYPPYIRIISGE